LILRPGRDAPIDGEVRLELLDFGRPELGQMPPRMKAHELPGPVKVARLRSRRVMTYPQDQAHLVKQPRRPGTRQYAQVDAQDRTVQQLQGRAR
jgi:hypothetical protein